MLFPLNGYLKRDISSWPLPVRRTVSIGPNGVRFVLMYVTGPLAVKTTLPYTAISRKVVGKNVHATIPKGNMGYDQYTVPNDCSCRTYFCCFPLALANICPWPLVPLFQFPLENRADKTTHNTFGIVACTTFLETAVYDLYNQPSNPYGPFRVFLVRIRSENTF